MNADYRLRLDGALDELYEPLWQVAVKLNDEEKALLRCAKLRRLHMVRHGGASFINSHHTYSRLQHTLGVFALAARFEPDNRALRIAALLHDCGHAPFSHTLDGLEGVDHHSWTREIICSEEVANILSRANIHPDEIMDYMEGSRRSLLRNKDGILHGDHLDSWVRSAYVGGYIPISPSELLHAMAYRDGNLQFTQEAGKHVAQLIWAEARMHGSPANIGINAMMRKLVRRLMEKGMIEVAKLPAMTDAHIEQLLLNNEETREEYEKLCMESWRIRVAKDKSAAAAETEVVSLRKFYLAMPLIDGISIAEVSPEIQTMIRVLEEMLGTYYVWWENSYDELVRILCEAPEVTSTEAGGMKRFGASGELRVDGKMFAFCSKGRLIVKLPKDRVASLIEVGRGQPCVMGRGRTMREWVVIGSEWQSDWLSIAEASRDFVAASPAKRK